MDTLLKVQFATTPWYELFPLPVAFAECGPVEHCPDHTRSELKEGAF